jgi:hypothetical protein
MSIGHEALPAEHLDRSNDKDAVTKVMEVYSPGPFRLSALLNAVPVGPFRFPTTGVCSEPDSHALM